MGNGDDSLMSNTGWGVMPPPMNSGADWGSSSGAGGSSSVATGGGFSSNNSGSSNNHQMSSTSQVSTSQSATGGNCWQIGAGRSQPQSVSSSNNSSSNSSGNEQASLLSSSPKLSSSWAQAAGKGLMSSSNNSGGSGAAIAAASASNANNSTNVINVQSSSNSNALNGAAACSSSNISGSSSAINGPSSSGNIFSQDSYSAAMNGSNNHNSNNNNLPGTTAGSNTLSNSAFGQSLSAAGNNNGANNSSGSSSNENLSGGNGMMMNNKRAIATPNLNDIIGNISEEVRETLLTDNWRSTVINQDSPWNLPPSPQSSPKDTSQWRCPVNSGTEIWENTVRQKKPCGGPVAASGGVVSAVAAASVAAGGGGPSAVPAAGMTLPIGIGGNGNGTAPGMVGPNGGGPSSAGGASSSQSSSWMQQTPTTPMGGHWGEPEEDPTKHWIPSAGINAAAVGGGSGAVGGNNPLSSTSSINNWQPNGIGASNSNNTWNTGAVDNDRSKPQAAAVAGGGISVGRKPWGAGYGSDATDSCQESNWSAESSSIGTWNAEPGKNSAWDRESNDGSKGPVDDGTAVWGNPGRISTVRVSGWKETPFGNKNNSSTNRNGFDQGWSKNAANFCVNGNANVGPAGRNHSGRSWMETPQQPQRKSPSWDDAASRINGHGSGGLPPGSTGGGWMTDPTPPSVDLNKGWNRSGPGAAGTHQRGPPRSGGDMNQPMSHLIGIHGCKKDEIENSLNRNQLRAEEAFRDFFDDGPSRRSNTCALPNTDRSHMGGMLGAQNAASAAVPGTSGGGGAVPAASGAINNSISPSIASSPNRQMVQLIQLAVTAGILNPQILNQPMSQHNLEVLNELLQQLKALRNLQPSNNMLSQMKIQTLKQNICNLQNQIHGHFQTPNSQFVMNSANKSNGRGGSTGGGAPPHTPPSSIDFIKPVVGGGGNGNNANTNELTSSFEFNHHQQQQQPPASSAGSKLGSWLGYNKLDANEFARAPGPLQKQNSGSGSNQWGANFGNEPDWSDKELSTSLMDDTGNYTNDFDRSYGSFPWKPVHGNGPAVGAGGAKPLDDDPRSRMQDPFTWNKSSPAIDPLFSSNPWSYNPIPSVSQTAPTNMFDLGGCGGSGKTPGKKPSWGNRLNANAPDYNINSDSLWGNASVDAGSGGNPSGGGGGGSKTRPPPGLSAKMAPVNPNNLNNASVWNNSGLSNTQSSSEYLRLSNLTPQIDGSTLKTLCLQHGPLNKFHLSLNHGIAIVRYATRDQALKAQSALNNCVLGNTTIYADLPSDSEIQQYSSISGNGGGSGGPAPTTLAQHGQQHQSTNNLNSLASTWSNGTNASHSHTAAGAGGNGGISGGGGGSLQSYQPQSGQAAAAQTRANSATTNLMNSVVTNPASASVLTTHSSSLPFVVGGGGGAASGPNNHHQYNGAASSQSKLVDPSAGGWNTTGAQSASMWSELSSASGANLWSSAGANFSTTTDRNTPTIQSFLPNDLLAGENN